MRPYIWWVLALLFLVACTQPPQPIVNPTPSPTPPDFSPKLLGAVQINFDSAAKTATLNFSSKPSGGIGAAFVDEATLKFIPSSFTSLDTSGGFRYLDATFQVQNLGAIALNNLTLVAYYRKKPGAENVGSSALNNIQNFGGGAADPLQVRPAHGMKSQAGSAVVDPNLADLQIFKPSETTALQTAADAAGLTNAGGVGGETVLQYGYVARNSTGGRNLTAPSTDNSLTVALRVPQSTDTNGTAYRFSMTFLIFEDSITRVTESLEEQGAGSGAVTRASAVGANQIALMCGSTYAGAVPTVFIPGVKIAGTSSTYAAWMGGNFTQTNETPPGIAVTGNIPKTFPSGVLLGGYKPLGGATLSAIGFTSTDSNLITSSPTNFTFTTQAGKRTSTAFTYQVSDGSCTSPAMPATANISGMYWFTKNDAAAGGTGRYGSPFNTLAAAQTASQAGDTIFVYRGNGSNSGQNAGITLKNNQGLIGEGVGLSVDDVNIAAGSSPLIANTGGVGVALAQGNTVRGIQISGSTFGISGTNPVNATLSNLAVTGVSNDGVNIGSSSGTNAISLQNSTILNSGGYGAYFYSSGTAAVNLSITGNTFQNNVGLALNALIQGSGNSTFDLSSNTIANTSTIYGGISVYALTSAAVLYQGRINKNTLNLHPGTADNNAGSIGIDLRGLGAGTTRAEVSGNTVTGYGAYGIQVTTESTAGTRLDVTLSNNNTTYPNSNGLAIRGMNLSAGTSGTVNGASTLCLNMSANTVSAALPARLQQIKGHTFAIQGFVGTGTDLNAVQTYLTGNNPTASISVRAASQTANVVVDYSSSTCTAPIF